MAASGNDDPVTCPADKAFPVPPGAKTNTMVSILHVKYETSGGGDAGRVYRIFKIYNIIDLNLKIIVSVHYFYKNFLK